MNFTTYIFLVIFQLVSSATISPYLFHNAIITVKNRNSPPIREKQFLGVKSLDHHIFPDAVVIKVQTHPMSMYQGAIKNLQYLKKLRLKECGITNLSPGCMRNLPVLEVVHLQDNDLTEIKKGVFNYLPIKELWLHRNEIVKIDPEAFDHMPNLQNINLNANYLKVWDNQWFKDTPQLSLLFFRKNRIQEIPARAFVNIRSSHKINGTELVDTSIFLSKNNISVIHPEAFYGIDALDELSLQRNKISVLHKRIFRDITELHNLQLSRNLIQEIDKNIFKHINDMSILNLTRNPIECVPYEIVSNLREISLSDNEHLDCKCVNNLIDKLEEEKIEVKIETGDSCE